MLVELDAPMTGAKLLVNLEGLVYAQEGIDYTRLSFRDGRAINVAESVHAIGELIHGARKETARRRRSLLQRIFA